MFKTRYLFFMTCMYIASINKPLIGNIASYEKFSNSEFVEFMIGQSCVSIDKFTYVTKEIHVREWAEGAALSIGKFTAIADDVTIFLGGNHHIEWITTYPFGLLHQNYFDGEDITNQTETKGNVTIGNDVWIGSHTIIMSGVTIGDGAIIAAYSVVTKDVEPYSIVGGNPAKFIRYRFDEDIRTALLKLRWWDLEINHIKELVYELCDTPNIIKINYWLQKYRGE